MKRTIIALTLAICLCFSTVPSVFASESANSDKNVSDSQYMEMVVEKNSTVEITPTDSYYLLDISGIPSYSCVEFDVSTGNHGFGIIDLTTYDVVMYALDAKIPFAKDDTVIYNGILQFAVINEDNTATILDSNISVPENLLYNNSRRGIAFADENMKTEKMRQSSSTLSVESVNSTEVLVDGGSDTSLVYSAGNNSGTWSTDCGINAVAMYLRHMDEYFNSNYVSSTHSTEQKLKVALAVLANNNFGQTTSISMDNLASLANKYMDSYSGSGVSSVSKTSYSWTTYKNRINSGNGKPCILYIGANATSYWTSAHAVVGVGYTGGTTSSSGYIIVNSGWTSLGYVQIGKNIPGSIIK